MELCKIYAVNATIHFDMTNGVFEMKDNESYDISWAKVQEMYNSNKYNTKLSYAEVEILPIGSVTGKTSQGHKIAMTYHKNDPKFWVYNIVQKIYQEIDFGQFCDINK